eukprot:s1435_g17.t1
MSLATAAGRQHVLATLLGVLPRCRTVPTKPHGEKSREDQLRSLSSVAQGLSQRGVAPERLTIACLDGDTPSAERNRVRCEARVVLTNPDMLHSHVLPQHVEYARLLQNARFIVLDEACKWLQSPNADPKQAGALHVVFHRSVRTASLWFVRLRRLVDEASLRFVACSATVANPGECPGCLAYLMAAASAADP